MLIGVACTATNVTLPLDASDGSGKSVQILFSQYPTGAVEPESQLAFHVPVNNTSPPNTAMESPSACVKLAGNVAGFQAPSFQYPG
jgi:hypothetical protein